MDTDKLFIILVIIAVAGATAYLTLGLKYQNNAEAIRDKTIEALDKVESYKFDVNTYMKTSGFMDGELKSTIMRTATYGETDLKNKRMHSTMTMSATDLNNTNSSVRIEMYLIDDVMYMLMNVPGAPENWVKQNLDSSVKVWEMQNQVEQQIEVMSGAEVRLLGEDSLNGVDCYVIEVKPDLRNLLAYVLKKQEPESKMAAIEDERMDELMRRIEYMQIKEWVSKDEYLPMKSVVEMRTNVENVTTEMTITINTYDFNRQLDLALPEAAANANEIMILPPGAEVLQEANKTSYTVEE